MISARRITKSIFDSLFNQTKIQANSPFRALASSSSSSFSSPSVEASASENVGYLPGRIHGSRLVRYLPPENGQPFFPKLAAVTYAKTSGTIQDQQVAMIDFEGKETESVTLGGDVFDVPIRQDIVHRVVRWQLAKRRQGTHSTKTISEISGTGRKPWKQKGTGKARQGTLRAPQFRGGATAHGPKPRSHEIGLPKQIRRLGLKVALSSKLAQGKLFVMRNVKPTSCRTKDMVQYLSRFGNPEPRKILFVDSGASVNAYLRRSTSNIPSINTLPAVGLNVYSLCQHETVIMSLGSVREIEKRLRTPIRRSPSFPSEVVLHPSVAQELEKQGHGSLVGNVLTLD